MKYYKDNQGIVFAYDETQMDLIGDKTLMTLEEIEAHINPVPTELELLSIQVAEAKQYLLSTDYKMTVDYFATLTDIQRDELTLKRAESREFIRVNEDKK